MSVSAIMLTDFHVSFVMVWFIESMAAEQQSVPSVDVCSTINIDPDIRHFVVEATPDTPCHMWCGCDVTVDDGGSLSVRVLMAELWGVNNCSTSLRLETYDIDDNATSLCSNGSHSMVLPRSGPTMKSVRIVFQRQNCTFDSRFGVDVFGANGSMTVVCTNNSDGPPEPHTKGLFGNGGWRLLIGLVSFLLALGLFVIIFACYLKLRKLRNNNELMSTQPSRPVPADGENGDNSGHLSNDICPTPHDVTPADSELVCITNKLAHYQ